MDFHVSLGECIWKRKWKLSFLGFKVYELLSFFSLVFGDYYHYLGFGALFGV